VFITEFECDNTHTERTPIEWRHVSGVGTHRTVTTSLYLIIHHFGDFCSHSSASITSIVLSHAALKISKHVNDKKYKGNINHNWFL
jgi:hypothetical protein